VWALRRSDLETPALGVGGAGRTLVERWDGRYWTTVLAGVGTLNGVGVVTSRDVCVVGAAHRAPLLMRWDGTSWTTVADIAPIPLPHGFSTMTVANDRTFGVPPL
jgi:hypothetical protein